MRFSPQILTKRLNSVRERIQNENLDGFLVSSKHNRYYLTDWEGDEESGYLLITAKRAFVVTDSRYTEEATEKIPHFELAEFGQDQDFWKNLLLEIKVKKVGFESKDLSVFNLKKFQTLASVKWIATTDLVETLRSQKDLEEVKLIKKAANICDHAFRYVLANIKVGQAESELAWKMESLMREIGAQKNAWEPFIVASGPNSSKVHYAASDRKIKKGDQVLFDWGCYYEGYASDISRVIFLGTPTDKQIRIYNLVLEAQKKAIKQIAMGRGTIEVDKVAKKTIQEKSEFAFAHAVGHGVGLEVHELPHVNSKTTDEFQIGNVVTVEPGIYEPGWGGVRLEDMVLVKKIGFEILTNSPKNPEQIIVK